VEAYVAEARPRSESRVDETAQGEPLPYSSTLTVWGTSAGAAGIVDTLDSALPISCVWQSAPAPSGLAH
jgi:hypothetical protein